VSLRVDAGEMVSIVGPSGSGKSTLLACLAGLETPDGGVVRINGTAFSRSSEAQRARLRSRDVGILLQAGNLLERHTVAENVEMARRLAGAPDRRATAELLEQLGLLDKAHALPATLSGGESARAGLAVALANHPDVVLADEPTGELDSSTATAVMALLRARARAGAAVVIVTHNRALSDAGDRVIAIRDGVLSS
jgi:putative ABC transport system ATP-binding protein